MPIQIPNLDDRNYEQLMKETAGVIARYFPEYADIGPTDPAVAINELFGYLFDITMYQINRVTPEARKNFASLLGVPLSINQTPEEALRLAHTKLARINRMVTAADIEAVVRKESLDRETYSEPVQRVWVRQNEAAGEALHVFVVQEGALSYVAYRHKEDVRHIYSLIRSRSPIGTRCLVAHAPVVQISLAAEIEKRKDSTISANRLSADIRDRLVAYIHPLIGGDGGDGWAFGKAVSRGDIYGVIEGMPGVDHVVSLAIKKSSEQFFGTTDTITPPIGGLLRLPSAQASITVI
ncbi:MAG: hypothetical protein FWF83_01330 [Clostridiales bacterium]|nr:hypothetical protein [Clostridiales bacterium]